MKLKMIIKTASIFILVTWGVVGLAFDWNQSGAAQVCEVSLAVIENKSIDGLTATDFSDDQCEIKSFKLVDPQNRLLWVKIDIKLNPQEMKAHQPLGISISGKASAKIFFNGHLLGSNGEPALVKEKEIPGSIDVVIGMPSELFRESENELVLLLSAHHGLLHLARPMHSISLTQYQNPTDSLLRYYWPSLLPFGVLLLGAFYLVLIAKMTQLPKKTYLLPLMALLASAQLFIEVYRGLVSYAYPLHDVRLLLILFCALGFGMCLMAYVLSMTNFNHRGKQLLALYFGIIASVVIISGFDYKSLLAIILPVFIAFVYAATAWFKGVKNMRFVALLLLFFLTMIFLSAYSFIDTVYYYFVALLIFVLMGQQAIQASQTRQQLLKDQARAVHLQQIIDQQEIKNSTEKLEIRSSGKVEWVLIKDISFCKGAGDYVELVLVGGGSKLYHGSITELSLRLPTTFLKTHRSYLVNTTKIESLQRNPSGAGQLLLSQGETVPVSRRILPQVREKLS